jgi:hypothetical protein
VQLPHHDQQLLIANRLKIREHLAAQELLRLLGNNRQGIHLGHQ